jgi:hypothetical protein
MRSAAADRLDPHRAGARVQVGKVAACDPGRKNIEQRLAQAIAAGLQPIANCTCNRLRSSKDNCL